MSIHSTIWYNSISCPCQKRPVACWMFQHLIKCFKWYFLTEYVVHTYSAIKDAHFEDILCRFQTIKFFFFKTRALYTFALALLILVIWICSLPYYPCMAFFVISSLHLSSVTGWIYFLLLSFVLWSAEAILLLFQNAVQLVIWQKRPFEWSWWYAEDLFILISLVSAKSSLSVIVSFALFPALAHSQYWPPRGQDTLAFRVHAKWFYASKCLRMLISVAGFNLSWFSGTWKATGKRILRKRKALSLLFWIQ